MSKKLIVFNWKMHPKKLKDVEGIVLAFDGIDVDTKKYEVAIAPPTVYLSMISEVFAELKADIRLAVQNCAWEQEGAFTGEISAEMVRQFGVEYAIVGHSERRMYFGETDEMVNKKLQAVHKARMGAILCVGEPIEVRKKGIGAVKKYIKNQLEKALADIQLPATRYPLTIAYEPVWAIGTGKAATSDDAVEIIRFIKETLTTRYPLLATCMLYGGSVNGADIHNFIGRTEIDGVLVGGASVDKKELRKILKTLTH